jgi:hypothetical protein
MQPHGCMSSALNKKCADTRRHLCERGQVLTYDIRRRVQFLARELLRSRLEQGSDRRTKIAILSLRHMDFRLESAIFLSKRSQPCRIRKERPSGKARKPVTEPMAASGGVKIVEIGRFENRCRIEVNAKGRREDFRSRHDLSCDSLCLRSGRLRRDEEGGRGRQR